MMGVYIKGMKMPKCCQDCPLNYDQMACIVTGTRWWSDTIVLMDFDSDKERLYDCPLTEIKTPYGRLVDADKLLVEHSLKLTEEFAPTVIEAEGSKE